MKAICWEGSGKVDVETVPDPKIIQGTDAIVRVTLSAICGSDLHLYNGKNDAMKPHDVLGHEFMGVVAEVGKDVRKLRVGDRVVVPAAIACGQCFFCRNELYSLCDRSNPDGAAEKLRLGASTAGLFGYSHLYGGFAGGQAQLVRVPYADVGPLKVPDSLTDEQVLFLGDVFPTGYMAAENCGIQPGQTVAVWGCGPVGLFAAKSAMMLGAKRVIAIDRHPERLRMAEQFAGAETLDYEQNDIVETLQSLTNGRGPDACIDAVGMEARGSSLAGTVDAVKTALRIRKDRLYVLREVIMACRPGGTVSIPGVYSGSADHLPIGAAFGKGLTLRMGHTNIHKYMKPLLQKIVSGEVDPSLIITHRVALQDAPRLYRVFNEKAEQCIKVVIKP